MIIACTGKAVFISRTLFSELFPEIYFQNSFEPAVLLRASLNSIMDV